MKLNIENYLHIIDTYFHTKSKKDIYMIYALVSMSIIAFSYLLFWDSSLNGYIGTARQALSVKAKIKVDNMYLTVNPEDKIKKLAQEIKIIDAKIVGVKNNNAYIKTKIETISSLIYDERAWGEYLYSISKNAKSSNIKIVNLKDEHTANNSSFGHILNITIELVGSYKNTLKFINSLEQSELVVDIHNLHIASDDEITTSLDISVWGITY